MDAVITQLNERIERLQTEFDSSWNSMVNKDKTLPGDLDIIEEEKEKERRKKHRPSAHILRDIITARRMLMLAELENYLFGETRHRQMNFKQKDEVADAVQEIIDNYRRTKAGTLKAE